MPDDTFSVTIAPSATSPNVCTFHNEQFDSWLYRANCIEFMDTLIAQHPDGLFDMIFADPPYFLSNGGITCLNGKMVKVDKGSWDKSQGVALNHEFNLAWISRCRQLLKPDGTMWVSGTQHVIHSIGFAMQQADMRLLNDIVWIKPNPPPNLSCRFFTHATETILWAAKSEKSKYCFNYEAMREHNGGKQMRNLWPVGIPTRAEKAFGKHPTQKSLALLERILLASTSAGDLVFDPFTGSGTTGVAAIKLKRKFLGCELEPEAAAIATQRMTQAIADILTPPKKTAQQLSAEALAAQQNLF